MTDTVKEVRHVCAKCSRKRIDYKMISVGASYLGQHWVCGPSHDFNCVIKPDSVASVLLKQFKSLEPLVEVLYSGTPDALPDPEGRYEFKEGPLAQSLAGAPGEPEKFKQLPIPFSGRRKSAKPVPGNKKRSPAKKKAGKKKAPGLKALRPPGVVPGKKSPRGKRPAVKTKFAGKKRPAAKRRAPIKKSKR